MSGPGEFMGHYGGKVAGGLAGYAYGGKAGAILGEELGSHLGSQVGKGLDQVVEAQSKAVKRDYDDAISQGSTPHQAIQFALDVNGLGE